MNELTIRKYKNRKLYCVELSIYVDILEIAGIIRQGHTIKVMEHETKTDITKHVLLKAFRALENDMGDKQNIESLVKKIREC